MSERGLSHSNPAGVRGEHIDLRKIPNSWRAQETRKLYKVDRQDQRSKTAALELLTYGQTTYIAS